MSKAWYSIEFIAFSAEKNNSIKKKEKNSDEYGKGEGKTLYSTDEEVTPPPCKCLYSIFSYIDRYKTS